MPDTDSHIALAVALLATLAANQKLLNCFCLDQKHRVPTMYATELTHISKQSSNSLLMDVTSHHLGQLSAPAAFAFSVGLVGGTRASPRIKQFLATQMDLDPNGDTAQSIKVSIESRFSPLATCHKSDFTLYRHDKGGFKAGKVQLHCEVHGLPTTMISTFDIHKIEADCGHSSLSNVYGIM